MKATLVRDKNRNGFRAIVMYEESGKRFSPSYPNEKEQVEVEWADKQDIIEALNKLFPKTLLGSVIKDSASEFKLLVDAFMKELVTISGGVLAWDEATNKGFFKIIQVPVFSDKELEEEEESEEDYWEREGQYRGLLGY